MEQKKILLDAVMLENIIKMFPILTERVDNLEKQLGLYKTSYEVKTVNVKTFCDRLDISISTYQRWDAAQLFQKQQHQKGGIISIPETEIHRISTLCKDVPHNARYDHLLKLKTAQIEIIAHLPTNDIL